MRLPTKAEIIAWAYATKPVRRTVIALLEWLKGPAGNIPFDRRPGPPDLR